MHESDLKADKFGTPPSNLEFLAKNHAINSPGSGFIYNVILNKRKVLQKFSTSLQNRRHFSTKNNTIKITIIYK